MGNIEKKKPEIYEKKWGCEQWIDNNEEYCAKLLCFDKGARFSMHFHVKKLETWYVSKGKLKCTLINTFDASEEVFELNEGEVIRIERYQPHRLEALEDSVVFEVSTQHFEDDSYRVAPGDSQK